MRIAEAVVKVTWPRLPDVTRAAVAVEEVFAAIVMADPTGKFATLLQFDPVTVGVIVVAVFAATIAVPRVPKHCGPKKVPGLPGRN